MYCRVLEPPQRVAEGGSAGALYVLCGFWPTEASYTAGDPAVLENDFVMPALNPDLKEVVRNRDGWWKRASDGVFVDPATLREDDATVWVYESIPYRAQVEGNIRRYMVRAEANGDLGDHTSRPGVRGECRAKGRLVRAAGSRGVVVTDTQMDSKEALRDPQVTGLAEVR